MLSFLWWIESFQRVLQVRFFSCELSHTEDLRTAFSHFADAVILREWPLRSASSLKSTSCAPCVETSSPTRPPSRVDTASACPASAATGHATSPNTAPTVRGCLPTGLTSVSTAFWQMSPRTTKRIAHRNHPRRKRYFGELIRHQE